MDEIRRPTIEEHLNDVLSDDPGHPGLGSAVQNIPALRAAVVAIDQVINRCEADRLRWDRVDQGSVAANNDDLAEAGRQVSILETAAEVGRRMLDDLRGQLGLAAREGGAEQALSRGRQSLRTAADTAGDAQRTARTRRLQDGKEHEETPAWMGANNPPPANPAPAHEEGTPVPAALGANNPPQGVTIDRTRAEPEAPPEPAPADRAPKGPIEDKLANEGPKGEAGMAPVARTPLEDKLANESPEGAAAFDREAKTPEQHKLLAESPKHSAPASPESDATLAKEREAAKPKDEVRDIKDKGKKTGK